MYDPQQSEREGKGPHAKEAHTIKLRKVSRAESNALARLKAKLLCVAGFFKAQYTTLERA